MRADQLLALLDSDPEALLFDLETKAKVAGKRLDLRHLHGLDGPEVLAELQTLGVLPTLEASDDDESEFPLPSTATPRLAVEVFPEWIARQVSAVTAHCQVPKDMAAFNALQAASAMLGPCIHYRVSRGWERHCGLYLCLIAKSGTGKSRSNAHFMRPLYDLQKEAREEAAPLVAAATAAIEQRQVRKRCLLDELKDAHQRGKKPRRSAHEIEADLVTLEQEIAEAEEVAPPTLWTTDVTPEHMVRLMAQNEERLAIVGAETPLFGLLSGRYTQQVIECVESFNDSFDGAPIAVGRVKRATVECHEPCLAVSVATQPIVLFNTGTSSTLLERGTLARFAFFEPVSLVGQRDMTLKDLPEDVQSAYDDNLSSLGRYYRSNPATFELSGPARRAFEQWRMLREAERMEGGRLSRLTGFEGRIDDILCRTAGLLHALNHHPPAPPFIGEATLRDAMRVTEFLIASTGAVYEHMGLGAVDKLAGAILEHARRNHVQETTVRELTRAPLGVYKTGEDVMAACRALANEGSLTLTKISNGGRPSWCVEFEPATPA